MIKEAWESYERDVLPSTAGTVQRTECRRAFYAGAFSLFNGVMTALSPGREAMPADISFMEELADELRAYTKSVE